MTIRRASAMGFPVVFLLCDGRPDGHKCEGDDISAEPERWDRVYANALDSGWVEEGERHYCSDCADERAGVLTSGQRPGVEVALAAVRGVATVATPGEVSQGVALCVERLESMLAGRRVAKKGASDA